MDIYCTVVDKLNVPMFAYQNRMQLVLEVYYEAIVQIIMCIG